MVASREFRQDDSDGTTGEDLEDRQSPLAERRRSSVEGSDARLTALAAPKVAPEIEKGDDLEREETIARHSTDASAPLAEVAAPDPVAPTDTEGRETLQNGRRQNVEDTHEDGTSLEKPSVPSKDSDVWLEIVIVSWLVFFSILGTLARLGVEAIATYPYAPFPSTVLWANIGGSFFIGFLLEDRRLFRHSAEPHLLTGDRDKNHGLIDKSKKTLPLYIGLATGFCGSFTSFSTFITDTFLALSNGLAPPNPSSPYHTVSPETIQPRHGGYSFMAALAVVLIHPALSISALKTGAHLAVGLEKVTPSLPVTFIKRFLDPLAILLGSGCWVGAVLLTIWPPATSWRHRATTALAFAPLGVLCRFYASKYLNARIPRFPLGTFAVNIFGTCIEGMCYDLQHTYSIVGAETTACINSCAVLEGVMQGFCGCATTVSTWVVELNSLRRRHGWFYGLASVGVALGFQVTIMGSVAWTTGFDQGCGS